VISQVAVVEIRPCSYPISLMHARACVNLAKVFVNFGLFDRPTSPADDHPDGCGKVSGCHRARGSLVRKASSTASEIQVGRPYRLASRNGFPKWNRLNSCGNI